MLDKQEVEIGKEFVCGILQKLALQLGPLKYRSIMGPERAQNYTIVDEFLYIPAGDRSWRAGHGCNLEILARLTL